MNKYSPRELNIHDGEFIGEFSRRVYTSVKVFLLVGNNLMVGRARGRGVESESRCGLDSWQCE
jgi:hypothetical protein